ncbi:MAG: hypothetical protein KJZ77_16635 [Anaerolineales bacterium]|nr:hypothetical protein [Anaerolineales bacterium]
MTIPESLGEALLVNGYESRTKSPDANAQGDFLYQINRQVREERQVPFFFSLRP